MSDIPIQKNRYITGVSFKPEVLAYLDQLARQIGMSRSWVLNSIVQEYAEHLSQANLKPLASKEAIIPL